MNRKLIARAGRCCVLIGVIATSQAIAQSAYPNRTLRLIVPFAAGGGADITGRVVAQKLTEAFGQQVLVVGPLLLLVWGAGLYAFLFKPRHPTHRVFALAYLLLAAFFIVEHGKAGYLMPIYPILFAGGAVFWERTVTAPWPRAARPMRLRKSTALKTRH